MLSEQLNFSKTFSFFLTSNNRETSEDNPRHAHARAYAHVHTYTHAQTHIHTHVRALTRTHTHARTHTLARARARTHTQFSYSSSTTYKEVQCLHDLSLERQIAGVTNHVATETRSFQLIFKFCKLQTGTMPARFVILSWVTYCVVVSTWFVTQVTNRVGVRNRAATGTLIFQLQAELDGPAVDLFNTELKYTSDNGGFNVPGSRTTKHAHKMVSSWEDKHKIRVCWTVKTVYTTHKYL